MFVNKLPAVQPFLQCCFFCVPLFLFLLCIGILCLGCAYAGDACGNFIEKDLEEFQVSHSTVPPVCALQQEIYAHCICHFILQWEILTKGQNLCRPRQHTNYKVFFYNGKMPRMDLFWCFQWIGQFRPSGLLCWCVWRYRLKRWWSFWKVRRSQIKKKARSLFCFGF